MLIPAARLARSRAQWLCAQSGARFNGITLKPTRLSRRSLHGAASQIPRGQENLHEHTHSIDDTQTASIISQLLNDAVSGHKKRPLEVGLSPGSTDTEITRSRKWSTASAIRPVLRQTILRAYPSMEDLTPIQSRLLNSLSTRAHLTVSDIPGTGKSFALATWLLNIERSTRTITSGMEPTTTAIVLVPNPQLAMQYTEWITNILKHAGTDAIEKNIPSFVQVLYRADALTESNQIARLQAHPNPHIIVSTPTRYLDILAGQSALLDINHLKLIVVDEADSLLDFESVRESIRTLKKTPEEPLYPPAEQLLDYIFKNRNSKLVNARKARSETNYIQLVTSSSSLSGKKMSRWIEYDRRTWLSPFQPRHGKSRESSPYESNDGKTISVRAGDLVSPAIMSIQREHHQGMQMILNKVHDSVKHHIVAYCLETGSLRDIPLDRGKLKQQLRLYLAAESEKQLTFQAQKNAVASGKLTSTDADLLNSSPPKIFGDDGYPAHVGIPVVQALLAHDGYPPNVLVGLGGMASKMNFKQAFEAAGLHAEILTWDTWKAHQNDVTSNGRPGSKNTTIWLTDPMSCAGFNTPGLRHVYILHRVERTRDYISYAGRVSRHPFVKSTTHHDGGVSEVSSHIISVLLEEYATPDELALERSIEERLERDAANEDLNNNMLMGTSDKPCPGYQSGKGGKVVRYENSNGKQIGLPVILRGSMFEEDAYIADAIHKEKIGCSVEPYIGAGHEVSRGDSTETVETGFLDGNSYGHSGDNTAAPTNHTPPDTKAVPNKIKIEDTSAEPHCKAAVIPPQEHPSPSFVLEDAIDERPEEISSNEKNVSSIDNSIHTADPSLSKDEIEEFKRAQQEVHELYAELGELMGTVWDRSGFKTVVEKVGDEVLNHIQKENELSQQQQLGPGSSPEPLRAPEKDLHEPDGKGH